MRPALPTDRRFIVGAWVGSFRTSDYSGQINHDDWYTVMWPQIEKVIDRPEAVTIVAYNPDDKSNTADLHGFVCADPTLPLVFYCYVKEAYRRWGIAKRLFKEIGIDPLKPFGYTHKTAMVRRLERKIPFARWEKVAAKRPRESRERNQER